MNTMLLQYALEVEKTGSITQAANNLYMEQPNLSKAIKSLEEMMGAPIFKRSSRGVVPTPRGKLFLEHAKGVLEQIDKMERVYKKGFGEGAEFRIYVPCATYISEAFLRFVSTCDRRAGMDLWMKETSSGEAMDGVADGTGHLGIIRYPSELELYYDQQIRERELHKEVIWEYKPVLLMSKDHPLAEKAEITDEDLSRYTEILHGATNLGDVQKREEEGGTRKKRIYVFEQGSQLRLLQTNTDTFLWVSPMPEPCLEQNHLMQRYCRNRKCCYRDIYLYRQDYQLNESDRRFLHEVFRIKQEITGE